jgi:hypothetical protein
MSPARRAKRFLPALLALAGFGAFCPKETPKPAAAAHAPELKLAPLSAQLSEPGGYFDSDNLISNETSYLQVAEQLADQVSAGGVYVGVGPDQNFNYIARVKPRYAFILDIRRQNMLQHLLFAALMARADDPYQYLCLLFSRACPRVTPEAANGGIERTLQALRAVAAQRGELRRQPAGRVPAHRGTAAVPAANAGPDRHPRHLARVLRGAGGDPLSAASAGPGRSTTRRCASC